MSNGFGKKVREVRGSLTQQRLAELLGVTIQHVQAVEYGKSLLSMDKLVLLCETTGRAPSFFLQDDQSASESASDTAMRDILSKFSDEQLELLSVALEAIKKNNDFAA